MDEHRAPLNGRLIFGVTLAGLGVLWTLDNLGVANAHEILRWWPSLLLAYGLMKLTGVGFGRQTFSGAFFSLVGGLLLADQLRWLHVGWGVLWPLFLIVIGIQIVTRTARAPRLEGPGGDSQEWIRAAAFMGGATRRSLSTALRGAELSAVMGGIELDLREAKPADQRVVVDVFAWWGGIEIVVPDDWRIEAEVTPVLGAFEDQREAVTADETTGTLVLRGLVIMGGVVLRDRPSDSHVRIGVSHRRGRRDRDEVREVHVTREGVTVRRQSASGEEREVRVGTAGSGRGFVFTTRPASSASDAPPAAGPTAPPQPPPPPEPLEPR
ncbi:MAG TPA: DUF5668 domain-containing protein [Candidatus Acidoferrales bacterium]|nr:DUF5668 domain-containing protein [Candidatus Acidoferrales bacterium]